MSKESISTSYMEAMKAMHASKPVRKDRYVFITGAGNATSIGQQIVTQLMGIKAKIVDCVGDLRHRPSHDLSYIDTLICCHGVTHLDWFEDCPIEKIDEIITVNLTESMVLARSFIRQTLEASYRKQIFFIGSMAYKAVLNGSAAYCASKAGLAHFAKCLAWELAPKGYDVFSIHPSNTESTPMTEETIQGLMRYRNLSREQAEGYWGACLPKAQWLQTQDIANLVMFLFEGKGEYLSGTQLELGGGQR